MKIYASQSSLHKFIQWAGSSRCMLPDFVQPGQQKTSYMMAGLQTKGAPSAARVAVNTPKLSRKPRTVAMIMKAVTAKRLSLKGGTLYMVPRNKPRLYSMVMGRPKLIADRVTPPAARPSTKIQASTGDSSPEGSRLGAELRSDFDPRLQQGRQSNSSMIAKQTMQERQTC